MYWAIRKARIISKDGSNAEYTQGLQWADSLWALKLHPARGDDPRRQALWEGSGQEGMGSRAARTGRSSRHLGTRKHDSPDVAPAGDLGTPQPPGLQETTFCCLSASLRDLQQQPQKTKTGLFDGEGQGSLACCSSWVTKSWTRLNE